MSSQLTQATRSWSQSPSNPWIINVTGSQHLQFCVVCPEVDGKKVPVEQARRSKENERLYQRCTSGLHGLFLGKDSSPVVVAPGLDPPITPPIPNRGLVGNKRKCAAPACNNPKGSKQCTTGRCARDCAEAALAERLAGRDGSILCIPHKKQIIALLEANANIIADADAARKAASTPITTATPNASPRRFVNPDGSIPTHITPIRTTTTVNEGSSPKPSPSASKQAAANPEKAQPLGRAMPANIKFPQPAAPEVARYQAASQRAHREDLAATQQIRVVTYTHSKKHIVLVLLKPAENFVIDNHPLLVMLLKKEGMEMVEVYSPLVGEWGLALTSTPWDLDGRVHILLRDSDLSNEQCEGLQMELDDLDKPLDTAVASSRLSASTFVPNGNPSITSPADPTSSPSLKRKASTEIAPKQAKIARIIPAPNVTVKTLDTFDPSTFKKAPHTRTRLIKDNPSDSIYLRLSFREISDGMELMRKLVVEDGARLDEAWHFVFEGDGVLFKRATFLRHRDVYFTARPEIVQRWSEHEGSRKWKEFYVKYAEYKGSVNRWYEVKEDLETESSDSEMGFDDDAGNNEVIENVKGKGVAHGRTASWKALMSKPAIKLEPDLDVKVKFEPAELKPIIKSESREPKLLIKSTSATVKPIPKFGLITRAPTAKMPAKVKGNTVEIDGVIHLSSDSD